MLRYSAGVTVLALALAGAAACSTVIRPASVQDAQTAVRVKTVLVNDSALGVFPTEVQVTNGVVRLAGTLPSEDAIRRAVALAAAVPGVVSVRSELRIGGTLVGAGAARTTPESTEAASPSIEAPPSPRMIGVGASVGWHGPRAPNLDGGTRVSPLIQIGSGQGLGLAIGLGWLSVDLRPSPDPGQPIARARIRPIMAGLSYTLRGVRTSASFTLLGGPSFNSLSRREPGKSGVVAVDVGRSLAWRSSVTASLDVTNRIAFVVSIGYLMTRPGLTLVEDGALVRARLRGDSLLLSSGAIYRIF